MSKSNIVELNRPEGIPDPLTELLKSGAQQLIYQAVEAEFQEFLALFSDQLTEEGRAAIVRNGYLPERELRSRSRYQKFVHERASRWPFARPWFRPMFAKPAH